MCKKSSKIMRMALLNESKSSQKVTMSIIKKYENYHHLSFERLVEEALQEQTDRVPEHQLSLYDRLISFREYLIETMVVNTVKLYMTKLCSAYRKCRVTIPYLPALNEKQCRRNDYITLKDILTKEEIKEAIPYLSLRMKARVMVMVTGGFSNAEADILTTRQFIDDLYQYHQCDDDIEALKYLADENHHHIWVTNLVREKTKKPYYALVNPETVQIIAQAKLKEPVLDPKLLTNDKDWFATKLRMLNHSLGYGTAGGKTRLRPHMLRKFHATYISGSVLNYEERSIITNAEIDELQGRGKTSVQDTYIKVNPLKQKVLYAKVMNNVSLYHEYDYEIVDGDVVVSLKNDLSKMQKLEKELEYLRGKVSEKSISSENLDSLREELGNDVFNELLVNILTGS